MIGGITLENIHQLRDKLNGAAIDYIAVTADIMGHSVDTIADKCLAWQQKLNTW